jgi:hypothetical protein
MSMPPRPRLTLRIGFAGSQSLDDTATSTLRTTLTSALRCIGQSLAELAPGVPVKAGQEPPITSFYSQESPLLRLVTGLCEGADLLAGEVLESIRVEPDAGCAAKPEECLKTELAAVLPFAVKDCRRSRPASAHSEFDKQLARCAYVLELDGLYAKPEKEKGYDAARDASKVALAQRRRARAYRAQSAYLLRHADVMIVAANAEDAGKAGGSLETQRAALAFELPVLLIHTGRNAKENNLYLIQPEDDVQAILDAPAPAAAEWQKQLAAWVKQIVADPDLAREDAHPIGHHQPHHPEATPTAALREYFDQADSPIKAAARYGARIRAWSWSALERMFARGDKPNGRDLHRRRGFGHAVEAGKQTSQAGRSDAQIADPRRRLAGSNRPATG